MQLTTRILSAIIFIVSLTACTSGGESGKPVIGDIYTDIYHNHSSFYDKWNDPLNTRIEFTISVDVSDPQGFEDLAYIYVQPQNQDIYWRLLDLTDNFLHDQCYLAEYDIFECIFWDQDNWDSIPLGNWEIIAGDRGGNESRKPFEFKLPGGLERHNEEFAYSAEYTGSKFNGVEALETMTIAENDIVFSSDPVSETFRIEFEATDDRAKHYSFAFYDGTADINYVGRTCTCDTVIQDTPIVMGQKVVIDFPWSDIAMGDGYSVSDINGLHIRLYDEPIEWITPNSTGIWFNYVSYSEFITLD